MAGEILITLSLGHSNWDGVEGREILGAVSLLHSSYFDHHAALEVLRDDSSIATAE